MDNSDYISEYLNSSGVAGSECLDKDKSIYTVNVNKCLDKHCSRSNKPRLENGKCPKKRPKSKSKSKSRLTKKSKKKKSRTKKFGN